MAKVTVHKAAEPSLDASPSEQVVKAASAVVTVNDDRGRAISIKKLGPVERMRMFKVIGPDGARNEAYLSIAALAFLVVSIDGEDVIRPTSELQVEAIIQRLGDEGLDAVGTGAVKHFGPAGEVDRDTVKNS